MTGRTTPFFGIDTTVPTTARMYDFWLGGHDNFAADRAAALKVSEAAPEAQLMAVKNRRFLRRAVRHLAADAGITQFLDIGTGLPTQGNVHQVAQDISPAARVVYVDNDHYKSGCAHALVPLGCLKRNVGADARRASPEHSARSAGNRTCPLAT